MEHEASLRPLLDVMNDPAYEVNDKSSSDEVDACRICRGESTADEPLFHPCKCNGSIKFVHQACLMEWLSHTQKKHCELCKTPFRFTKLYHPQMPQKLPTAIFLKRAFIHAAALALMFCRWLLVGLVWFIWLPWCMRLAWRGLFWLGDGAWSRDMHTLAAAQALQPAQYDSPDSVLANITSGPNTTSAALTHGHAPPPILPSQPSNNSSEGSLAFLLVKKVLESIGQQLVGPFGLLGVNATAEDARTLALMAHRRSSVLSEITYLNSFFASPALNRFLLDILEGIMISSLVVVAFILVFLIREWVVQQQPVINAAAADAANAIAQAGPPRAAGEPQPDDLQEGQADPGPGTAPEPPSDDDAAMNEEIVGDSVQNRARSRRHDPLSRDEIRRIVQDAVQKLPPEFQNVLEDHLTEAVDKAAEIGLEEVPTEDQEWSIRDHVSNFAYDLLLAESQYLRKTVTLQDEAQEASGTGSGLQDNLRTAPRPNMPARERSFMATEIRRGLEERSFTEENSETRLRQLRDEGDREDNSDGTSESWQHLSDLSAGDDLSLTARPLNKGKAKAVDPYKEEEFDGTVKTTTADDEQVASAGTSASASNTDTATRSAAANNSLHSDYDSDTSPSSSSGAALVVHPESSANSGRAASAHVENAVAVNRGWVSRTSDWFWGDVAPAELPDADEGHDDEHVVQDLDHEAPFVPFGEAQADEDEPELDGNQVQDPEVAAAAAQAGIDVNEMEAVEDAEDLEGVLELVGLQGPITGLFQNAMFSAILITATITGAVWGPYLWGKVVILFIANPFALLIKTPLRIVSAVADFMVDLTLFFVGSLVYWTTDGARLISKGIGWFLRADVSAKALDAIAPTARSTAESALQRVANIFLVGGIVDSDFLHLSVNSHAALRKIQTDISQILATGNDTLSKLCHTALNFRSESLSWDLLSQIPRGLYELGGSLYTKIQATSPSLSSASLLKISLDVSRKSSPIDPTLAYWSATDRTIAVLVGYAFFAVAGALYLKRGAPITNNEKGHRIEAVITDILQQAGGVLKVILIIGIEMIAFPLYCGLLLDLALLPLFENASITTRLYFMWNSPFLSTFVHWFIGTCYMFHFALFVSMCRRIMRDGVLYFIRDPDDPTFHPVRDVLERSVMTQLRKIAFSALVYGALVILCLGGVVWGLYWAFDGVLPIHWTGSETTLEVPLDLLFYNFITPLVVRNIKPSDGLQSMYEWWFNICARVLMLSDFLFGDKRRDEPSELIKQFFASRVGGVQPPDSANETDTASGNETAGREQTEVSSMPTDKGRWVLAPASDSVRIPRGASVFVETDSSGRRLDGKEENGGFQPKTLVYIPPWFRVRVGVFVLTIWLFAAATGLGVTVVPLLLGRKALSLLLGNETRTNDVYAFSLGAYALGGLLYLILHHRDIISSLRTVSSPSTSTARATAARFLTMATYYLLRALRLIYVYTSLAFLFPLLLAFLAELYAISPLHAYLAPDAPHTIHLVQDWTLGILYLRLALRSLRADPTSRPARALDAVVRNGWTDPSARLATRCFVLPGLLLFAVAAGAPWGLAKALNTTWFAGADDGVRTLVYRGVYPVCLAFGLGGWGAVEVWRAAGRWRSRIRDEVYLIGERLHNFGEKSAVVDKGIGARG